jgi:hypothetical protein
MLNRGRDRKIHATLVQDIFFTTEARGTQRKHFFIWRVEDPGEPSTGGGTRQIKGVLSFQNLDSILYQSAFQHL